MLNLMYITNRPTVAQIAENAGVDRVFIDMEYIGKDERQAGLDTVKSHHTIEDIKKIRKAISKSELLVRVNPIHDATEIYVSSEVEINQAMDAGADIIMLPMFKTVREVQRFLEAVNGHCKTMLLIETSEAVSIVKDLIEISEIDEMHIGLNDLHLALKRDFMFELLADGTVDKICGMIKPSGKKYGFGGIARLGYGDLPAEYIIAEHYRLGSQIAILSRSFCNANIVENPMEIESIFQEGIHKIRRYEEEVAHYTQEQFESNRLELVERVNKIISR